MNGMESTSDAMEEFAYTLKTDLKKNQASLVISEIVT